MVKGIFVVTRALMFSVCLMLVGCTGGNDLSASLHAYLKDLNRHELINISPPVVRFPQYKLPPYAMKQQELAQFDIGLLEFLSLQQCDLGILVGKKNSVLGKVMPNSQRFLYEVRVIKALNECEPESVVLRSKLSQVAVTKRAELAKAYANAIYNSQETDVFYSVSNGYLPLSENQSGFQSLRISLDKLAQLGHMLEVKKSAAFIVGSGVLNDFEHHFKNIHDSEYAGRLLRSLIILTDYLNAIADNLSVLDTSPAFCRGPIVFLKQKFKTHYVEKIQPYMARVNSTAYEVLASLSSMQSGAAKPSADLVSFLRQFSMEETDQIWSLYQESAQNHARQWNRLLRSCHVF